MRTAHVGALCLCVFLSMIFLGIWETGKIRAQTSCDVDCLNTKLEALTKRVVALESKTATSKVSATGKTKETFVNISGGSMVADDWTKLSGSEFWFDQSLYGNVTEVTWQGWIDNGVGMARLYDATNNRAVDGSEVTVTGEGRSSFYSRALSIWRGQNMYYIQLKSQVAGVVVISSPRLRVVTK